MSKKMIVIILAVLWVIVGGTVIYIFLDIDLYETHSCDLDIMSTSDIEEFKPYITHGVNGFLFENGNDKALGDLFNKVICMSAEDRINIKQQQLLERERYKEKCDINESFNSIFKKINFF